MYNPKKVETEIREHWKKNKIPEKIVNFDLKSKKEKFYLLDGPPYANALPHAGHVMTTVFKDMWSRLKTMQGYQVWWQPGFDCHGLPIENKVEKEIGVKSKRDIEKYGVSKFIKKCKDFSTSNLESWLQVYKNIGAWRGWKEPYLTYNSSYIESGWWTIKQLYEKGLLVQGKKPIHWCPSCETALSGYEVTDSYKDVEDPSIYIKFPVKGKKKEYLLAWTTTPWTLPANVALIVHPDETYVKIEVLNEKLILAKKLLETVAQKTQLEFKIVDEFKGKKLVGMKYEPLLDVPIQKELSKQKKAHIVVESVPILKKNIASKVAEKKGLKIDNKEKKFGHLVTMDTGTGIVHCAPGHGAEDNKIGEKYNLPIISPVNESGKLEGGTGFDGLFVKDADPKILEYLEKNNRLFYSEKIIHSYPVCWRCKSPLVYRLSTQWFFLIDQIKEKMINENEKIVWFPENAKERMKNWLTNASDWCVSIQRFWGIPFPIWQCDKCSEIKVIGGKEELEKEMRNGIKLSDLHKDVVDKVILKCKCGGKMKRIPDLLNIWVESGISPWASLGYPHRNKELFEELWPVDLVDESQDQIRGWFYSLLFMGMATFDKKSCNTICLNGWMLDEKGEKMSKSLGNVILASEAHKELGADILRLYICSDIAPWETHKVSIKDAKELFKILNIISNLEKFTEMYHITFTKKVEVKSLENKWILSKLNSLIKDVTFDFEHFRFHFVARKLTDFILNDFSRFYMKLAKENIQNKETAYVFGEVLKNYLKLLAPLCPFITEKLYLNLFSNIEKKESIHLCTYPKSDKILIDKKLEEEFKIAQEIIENVQALRQKQNIKLRWPIKSVFVAGNTKLKNTIKDLDKILKQFCNCKELKFENNLELNYEIKPNYREFGKQFGKNVSSVVTLINKENPNKLKKRLDRGPVKLGEFKISKELLNITENLPKGKVGNSISNGVVLIDATLDKNLKEESLIRDLIRAVQLKRKEAKLKIADKIELTLKGPVYLKNWENTIKENIVTSKLIFGNIKGEFRSKLYFEKELVEFGFNKD